MHGDTAMARRAPGAALWQAYLDLNQELYAALEAQLQRDAGLSGADYAVLVPLSTASDGVLRARELGTEIGWDRSRLSHHVSRMERRGLVAREECSEDGRGSMVRLTDTGRAAIEGAAPEHCRGRPSLLLRSAVGGGTRHTHCGLRTSPRRDGATRRVTAAARDMLDTGVNVDLG